MRALQGSPEPGRPQGICLRTPRPLSPDLLGRARLFMAGDYTLWVLLLHCLTSAILATSSLMGRAESVSCMEEEVELADLPSAAALIRGLALLCPGLCTLAGSIQKQPISCPRSTPMSLEQRPSMGEPPGRMAGKLVPTRDAGRHGLPPAPLGVRRWMAQRLKSKGGNLLLSASPA